MKKYIFTFLVALVIFSCSSEKEGNMKVSGTIKGLKKGKLYLQKVLDSTIVSVDSVTLLDKNTFTLVDNIETPQVYFLTFDGNNKSQSIRFFGEEGSITINSDVDLFEIGAEITGSKNQEVMEQYLKVKKFSNKNLDFVKREFDLRKANKADSLEILQKQYENHIKRRYLYTTNFALNNKDYEVAPYLALTELYDANITLLDTINNSLTDNVKSSVYGKELEKFIQERKELGQ
ncbi:DUF4369 domain-containing protein [Polaribacter sp.]|nr:DUF4369 domain-containing protein [Polaribacter sp.]